MASTTHSTHQLELRNEDNSDLTPNGRIPDASGTHCHVDKLDGKINSKARRQLVIASILCLVFMTGEIIGGVLAHSLALMSDGAHLLTDFASFMISLLALYLGKRRSTKKLSFGWYRVEILGALVSILMLWLLTGILCYSAGLRIVSGDYHIEATIMLITAACGVVFNVALGLILCQSGHGHSHGGLSHGHSHGQSQHGHSHGQSQHGHSHGHSNGQSHQHGHNQEVEHINQGEYTRFSEVASTPNGPLRSRYGSLSDTEPKLDTNEENINVKAAFIHVLGDLLQSIGVLIAAFIIYFKPEWKMADPICTFLFSVFVLVTTITILRDIIVILMEGTPSNVDFSDVRDAFFSVKGVKDIHNLRVWALTMDKIALSVHIAVDVDADPLKIPKLASCVIREKFGITETTMQIEAYTVDMLDCVHCQHLKD